MGTAPMGIAMGEMAHSIAEKSAYRQILRKEARFFIAFTPFQKISKRTLHRGAESKLLYQPKNENTLNACNKMIMSKTGATKRMVTR